MRVDVEVRDLRDEDRGAVRRLRFRTFSAASFEPDADELYIDDDRRVVAVVDDRIVGHAGAWRFGQFFGGRELPTAAVAAVLVEPHARGAGVSSRMVRRLIERAREQGDLVATLYPATVTPYRRLGWEFAGSRPRYRVPTRSLLSIAPPTSTVTLRPGTPDDARALHELYLGEAARHDGWFALGARYLAYNMGDISDEGPEELWVAQDEAGRLRGYVAYERTQDDDGSDNVLKVRELVAADADTERALWRLLGGSWTIWPVTRFRAEVHPLLRHLLAEDDVTPESDHGSNWMLRLLDVSGALAGRGYPGVADATVHLQVRDDQIADNDGRFVLHVRDGRGEVERGGDGTVRTDVGALSSMFTGYTPASTWQRLGRLTCDDPAPVAALDAVLRGPAPSALHYF